MMRSVDRLIKYYKEDTRASGVELGDFTGSDAFKLLEECPGLVLHWVCPWRRMIQNSNCGIAEDKLTEQYEKGKKSLDKFRNRSQVINGSYDEVSYSFKDGSLDFVFFNTLYKLEEKMKRDILLWLPKVKDEGMIIGTSCPLGRFKTTVDLLSNIVDFASFDEGTWALFPVKEDVRLWAIENSKREGDWNESGYFETSNPDLRPFK